MHTHPRRASRRAKRGSRAARVAVAAVGAALLLTATVRPALLHGANSGDELTGREIIEKVNQRSFGRSVSQRLTLRITDPKARVRERGLLGFRSFTPTASRLAFYVTSPPDMRNMAYLVHDRLEPGKDDDQWIYTPARATPRRLAAMNLRESFLGSEFTLDDVKKFFRIEIDHYDWKRTATHEEDGRTIHEVEQTPRTEALAKALGVSRMRNFVDGEHWVRLRVEQHDLEGRPLRSIRIAVVDDEHEGPQLVKAAAKNVQTGAVSKIAFHDRSYERPIEEGVFTLRGLQREEVVRLERGFAHPRE